jgi:hypothetical protein
MSRFNSILKGTLARKPITVPMWGGATFTCDVVPLLGGVEAEVLKAAREFAQKRGIAEPRNGDPIYELGIWVHTLLHACKDHETPAEAPAPFFESADEILDHLDRDRIALLFEAQQSWQDHCAPRPRSMDTAEYFKAVIDHAIAPEDAEELPFERFAPILRRGFVHFMARQLYASLQLNVLHGLTSQGAESSSKSASENPGSGEPPPSAVN